MGIAFNAMPVLYLQAHPAGMIYRSRTVKRCGQSAAFSHDLSGTLPFFPSAIGLSCRQGSPHSRPCVCLYPYFTPFSSFSLLVCKQSYIPYKAYLQALSRQGWRPDIPTDTRIIRRLTVYLYLILSHIPAFPAAYPTLQAVPLWRKAAPEGRRSHVL